MSRHTWQLPKEQRIYVGPTHDETATSAREGMQQALEAGYVADRVEWSGDFLVTVEYLHDPARAGRPL